MNTPADQSIIEKIQKCLALGQSPNENEAKRAMEQVSRLLTKHHLSMDDILKVKKGEINHEIILKHTYEEKWKSFIIGTIATHYYCKMLLRKGRGSVEYIILGTDVNREIVRWTVDYVLESMEKITKKECKGGSREAFKYGLAMGLYYKFEEIKEAEKRGDYEGGTALMVVGLRDKAEKENNKYMNDTWSRVRTGEAYRGYSDNDNYREGKRQSENISLNKPLK